VGQGNTINQKHTEKETNQGTEGRGGGAKKVKGRHTNACQLTVNSGVESEKIYESTVWDNGRGKNRERPPWANPQLRRIIQIE